MINQEMFRALTSALDARPYGAQATNSQSRFATCYAACPLPFWPTKSTGNRRNRVLFGRVIQFSSATGNSSLRQQTVPQTRYKFTMSVGGVISRLLIRFQRGYCLYGAKNLHVCSPMYTTFFQTIYTNPYTDPLVMTSANVHNYYIPHSPK